MKNIKVNNHRPVNQSRRQVVTGARGNSQLPRWLIIALCLAVAGGGTWALCEFVIFNKLPSELVGKWVVVEGPQEGATFDFFRSGAMVGKVNIGGREGTVNADIRLEDKKMHWMTRSKSGEPDTRVKLVRTLTANQLIIEDIDGTTLVMERAR